MGRKKKFIDKKEAITFRLVHRSQKDPLTADENAPKRVLQPIERDRKDDLEKYGIFYDDDYDYMQHLKETTSGTDLVRVTSIGQPKVQLDKVVSREGKAVILPSSVFPSEVESKVGLLNKAAPKSGLQLDLDPDIVAAMDEDFDFSNPDNLLDDDFVLQANCGSVSEQDGSSDVDFDVADETDDLFLELEETKSRFTEYSMTSSVIKRNEQLSFLDSRFEKMFEEYDDNEIGALDCDEIEGELETGSELLMKVTGDFEKSQVVEKLEMEKPISQYVETDSDDSSSSVIAILPKDRWDCESILSTYSNIYNHPKVIPTQNQGHIKINCRTGIPINNSKLTKNSLKKLEGTETISQGPGSISSMISSLSVRPKDETSDDRKNRKQAYKCFKKERRLERKCNKEAFKEEKKRMEKVLLNKKILKTTIPI